jgi:asparagine synthase (glutamine-hydrolysing)
LKIIDLEGGDQPMRSEDGDTIAIFNGEIYNHAELRAELESLGHCFRTRCDTEVLLKAFLEWDVHCFRGGMFAVGSGPNRAVVCVGATAWDQASSHRRGSDVYFGWNKTLFGHAEIPREPILQACTLSIAQLHPCPYTLVDGIEKPPPAIFEWRLLRPWSSLTGP